MFADLHLHTAFSDGTYSPEELAGHAQRHGLAAIALTDHDSVEGCERMAAACRQHEIEFVPGAEFTAELDGQELHLLGYFLDTGSELLLREMAKFQQVRQDRIHEMVQRLKRLGISLEAQAVFRLANCRSPGRPHVARALVRGGYCESVDEAFDRFLKRDRPAWAPKMKIPAPQAIELIHAAAGAAVLAHPGLNRRDHWIPALVEAGLDGLECFHSKHSAATSEHYVGVAHRNGLLITGGSDCHGLTKGKPTIGSVKLPYARFVDLKSFVSSRSAPAARRHRPISAIESNQQGRAA
jgi:predicted metal-dependent phosphoesterase TrpH